MKDDSVMVDSSERECPSQAAASTPVQIGISRVRRMLAALQSASEWVFGILSLLIGLAMLSVIPVLNLLSLGYLIHASGQTARTGRFQDGLVGVRKAAVLGRVIVGSWIVFLPARIVSGLWKDLEVLQPGSFSTTGWRLFLFILVLAGGLQVVWACLRGGLLRHFFWPAPLALWKWMQRPGQLAWIRNALLNYVHSLRLPYYFWLGARAFIGGLIWLSLPVGILMVASRLPPEGGGAILSLLGGFVLMPVAGYLPFLQVRFAVQNRFGALFECGEVRKQFPRAPYAFLSALMATLLFATPLYLLKIELPPREIAWLPSILFVVFLWPARIMAGWAVSRAARRQLPRHWFFRWTGRAALLPLLFAYALVIYLTQYLSWHGTWSLLEQHAFLVPAPLLSL